MAPEKDTAKLSEGCGKQEQQSPGGESDPVFNFTPTHGERDATHSSG